MILGTVALIQCLQSLAGKILTLKTESDPAFTYLLTGAFHIGAVFVPWYAAWTVGPMKSLPVEIILLELI
jgi:hypothetical protein